MMGRTWTKVYREGSLCAEKRKLRIYSATPQARGALQVQPKTSYAQRANIGGKFHYLVYFTWGLLRFYYVRCIFPGILPRGFSLEEFFC